MITIKTFVFNPFQENTYLLFDDTKECVIIDAGCQSSHEKEQIRSFIKENSLVPVKLLNTHCHVDHLLGSAFVTREYNIKLEANKEDSFLIDNAVSHGKSFGFDVEQPPQIGTFIKEGDIIEFGNSKLHAIHVPGHSPGSIAYHNIEQKFVLVGDVLFSGSIGRTDLPKGDYDTLIENIKTKLLTLEGDTAVYTGHGPSTTIIKEKRTNPFLL